MDLYYMINCMPDMQFAASGWRQYPAVCHWQQPGAACQAILQPVFAANFPVCPMYSRPAPLAMACTQRIRYFQALLARAGRPRNPGATDMDLPGSCTGKE